MLRIVPERVTIKRNFSVCLSCRRSAALTFFSCPLQQLYVFLRLMLGLRLLNGELGYCLIPSP